MELLKSAFLGIVEGITEWLPVSSTGHMILVNEFISNTGFTSSNLYLYVIQLGAILAVVTLYFRRLNPFAPSKSAKEKSDTWQMWFKIAFSCLPAAVFGLLLNDFMEHFENWLVVSVMLIIYGVAFLLIEKKKKQPAVTSVNQMSYKTAFLIGLFQVLSIVPGTSRSGSTILGGMLLGCSRAVAAEFSFFLAIPVMFGVSLLKIVTSIQLLTAENLIILLVGMAVAYIVSLLSIKLLVSFVKKHSFSSFGIYRIILGVIIIFYFMLI